MPSSRNGRDLVPRLAAIAVALSLPLAFAVAAGAARTGVSEVPLEWSPSTGEDGPKVPAVDVAPLAGVRIRIDRFADGRDGAPGVIGENHGGPGDPVEVTTPDDVPGFVTDRFLAILRESRLPVVDERMLREMGADIVDKRAVQVRVRGEIQRFFVTEEDHCDAEVRLGVVVEDSQGRPIWSGTSSGQSGRIARSYKVADYQGSLSDALLEATAQLLRSSDFLHALEGRK
jgi:hypothetical protein